MNRLNQEVVTKHWNERARSYRFNIKRDFMRNGVDERWRDLLAEALGDSGPLKVLDAGCGPAVLTRLLLDLGHEVTAVDTSQKMLDYAKEIVGDANGRVKFQQGNVAELPFEDAGFDLIISRYVVWTLPDPAGAMAEWRRLLKPGGRMGVIDGNWHYFYYRSFCRRNWARLSHLFYKIRSGFDPSQKSSSNYALDLPTTQVLRPDWDLGVLAGLGFTDVQLHRDLERRIWGRFSLKRLRYPWSDQFLLVATKPAGD
jgi:ubiquinone/menaquinone biosynthesis C-methylase UbiE